MRTVVLILLCAIAAVGGARHSFHRPVFVYQHHPDLPISRFAAGNLGIPDPAHARLYLYAVYRYLSGKPFSEQDQIAFVRVWGRRLGRPGPEEEYDAGFVRWNEIRRTLSVAHASEASQPGPVATRSWVYHDLCSDHAFATAASTLQERIRQFGARSREVRIWIEGQDAVFQSCNPASAKIPPPLAAGVDSLIRADREYQIAAALFYAQRLDEAFDQFRHVSQDAQSPWKLWAPYLMGRTLLWQARFTQDEETYRTTLLQAERQFLNVVSDPQLEPTDDAAEKLLVRCMFVTRLHSALERLGERLNVVEASDTLENDLFMYLGGMDNLLESGWGTRQPVGPRPISEDEISRWILNFQDTSPASHGVAVRRWRETGSNAWLYSALFKADGDSPETVDLVRSARTTPIEQPGGVALRFQAARLLAERGMFDQAREELDTVVSRLQGFPSALNRAKQLETQLAADIDHFLRFAPRRVILASRELDELEFNSAAEVDPNDYRAATPELEEEMRKRSLASARRATSLASLGRLDTLTAHVFNTRLPLQVLHRMASTRNGLPAHLIDELRLAVFTRAILLGRFTIARDLGPIDRALTPQCRKRCGGSSIPKGQDSRKRKQLSLCCGCLALAHS